MAFFAGWLLGPNPAWALFGTTGIVTTDASSGGSDQANCIIRQPDGKLVAVGYANSDFCAVRYNSDGSLDNTFDGDGIVTTSIGSSSDEAKCVVLQPDGKLVL